MKHLFLFCIVIATCIESTAQKDFEGEINYLLAPRKNPNRQRESDDDTLRAKVFFGPQRLRVVLAEGKEPAETETLIMLDSGLVYRIHQREKSYTRGMLSEIVPDFKINTNSVSGYAVSPVEISNWGHIGGYAQLLLANDLQYHIPGKYKHNMEIMMVRDNRIILKGQVVITSLFGTMNPPGNNPEESIIVDINAESVKPGPLPLTYFQLPADYVLEDYSGAMSDTITYDTTTVAPMVDTTAYIPAPPVKKPATTRPPVKKPASKPVSKPAIRKEQ